ncbi:amphi-Trp domain-containing protein [Halorubellus sp. PRR65]|uniref:amphi-Trp domain-containing protein n=1 Tax=Halorubellus sp. PRR65 TaxID=3098148 RepID=UPI002B2642C3|nr:amphi-Trp domain-containing protein [Halorubellus sp. PRR65]
MPEEVLFETESKTSRADIAAILRNTADKLEANDAITLSSGSDSITLDPPASPEFEVKAERETAAGQTEGELSIEFEIEWDERDPDDTETDGTLSIE